MKKPIEIQAGLEYEILTMPETYKLSEEHVQSFNKFSSKAACNIINKKSINERIEVKRNIWDITTANESEKDSQLIGKKRRFQRTSLKSDDLQHSILILFQEFDSLSLKEIEQLLDHPVAPIKA